MKKVLGLIVLGCLLAACNGEKRLFQQAQLATSKGRYEQAMQLYSRLIKKDPQNAAAYANRGLLWERLPVKNAKERAKNRAYAEQDYIRSLEINPLPQTFNNLGGLYIDMGRNMDAINQFSDALDLEPNYFTARINRAIAEYRMGLTEAALSDFNQASFIKQEDASLFLNRGLVYFDLGQYEQAIEDFSHLIALEPQNARAYLERARALSKFGYPADAYADLEQAVALKPSYALAYYYMGDLMFRKGEAETALGLLVKSKELASRYAPTYDLMGDMLALEDPIAATANYMTALKLDPANAAKYRRKMQLMRTEKGRESVMTARFFPR